MTAKRFAFQAIDVMSRAISPDILARVAKFMHFKALFDQYAIDLIFDVGANGGQFATTMRDYGFAGDILSFEPVSAEFARLSAAAKADSKWVPINCALGASEAEQPINIMAESVFSSFNQPSSAATTAFAHENQIIATELVKVRRLDHIIAERDLRGRLSHALLKCDTQGFDLQVLEGAGAMLDKIKLVQIEMNVSKIYENAPSMTEMLRVLDDHGFAPVALFPVNRLADGSALEFDYLGVNRRLL
jgi:FkbM family methyltransferase